MNVTATRVDTLPPSGRVRNPVRNFVEENLLAEEGLVMRFNSADRAEFKQIVSAINAMRQTCRVSLRVRPDGVYAQAWRKK